MVVKPVNRLTNRLTHGEFVKVADKKTVGNYANAEPFRRQGAQHSARAGNHWDGIEEIALCHREAMQAFIFILAQPPLGQAVGDVCSERIKWALKPFGGNFPHATVRIGANAVEIDPQHELSGI